MCIYMKDGRIATAEEAEAFHKHMETHAPREEDVVHGKIINKDDGTFDIVMGYGSLIKNKENCNE